MDLPHLPDEKDVLERWIRMVRELKNFLKTTFQVEIVEDRIEAEIRETNRKNCIMNRFFEYAACHPVPIHWRELYDIIGLDPVTDSEELQSHMERITSNLDERVDNGIFFGFRNSPRVW